MKNNNEDFEVVLADKLDENTTLITTSEHCRKVLEQAMYDFESKQHLYSKYLTLDSLNNNKLKDSDINELAHNPQDDLDKIKLINSYARYFINRDDLVGKVYETIEGNVNTEIKLNFKEINAKKRNKSKQKKDAEEFLIEFNSKTGIPLFLRKCIPMAYAEGNYISYLRGNKDNFIIDYFPLGVAQITDYEIDGEPVVVIDVNELKLRLKTAGFKDKKGKNLIHQTIDEEIQRSYPPEVYQAYLNKERFAILDHERTGVVRIGNMNRKYGVTPIFRTFKPQMALEVFENSDRTNASAKGKKIIAQILRKELMGEKYDLFDLEKIAYAHNNFMTAFKNEVVVVTAPPWVEKIEYVETKLEPTDTKTTIYYRNKILTALGISFISNESKSSFNTVEVNVKELMKTINKISEQIESILKKWYKLVLRENGMEVSLCPDVKIIDSELMDNELKLKLADTLFGKLGASYQTVYSLLGLDYEDEKQRRKEENDEKAEEIFSPRLTNYTISGSDLEKGNRDKTEENQNKDKDKQQTDKDRYKNQV